MNQRQLALYHVHVDSLLAQLRRAMEGWFQPCLPSGLTTRKAQREAIYLVAEGLSFHYATAAPTADDATLYACRTNLRAALTFLLFECNPSDRTFDSLLRIAGTEQGLLGRLVEHARHTPRRFQRLYRQVQARPGNFSQAMPHAIARYLAQQGKLPDARLCTRAVDVALRVLKDA